MNSETGFLISYLKYGENDAILNAYTTETGYQTFFYKNMFSKNSKKRAFLMPFSKLCFNTIPQRKGNILTTNRLDLVEQGDFYLDAKKNCILFFVADVLNQILRNEQQNIAIYEEIDAFLNQLAEENFQSHLVFLINMLKIQGVSPLLSSAPFLNPELGIFENTSSHHLFNENISVYWKSILSSEEPYIIQLSTLARRNLLEGILVYFHYHISEFRNPVSLEIVQQILE